MYVPYFMLQMLISITFANFTRKWYKITAMGKAFVTKPLILSDAELSIVPAGSTVPNNLKSDFDKLNFSNLPSVIHERKETQKPIPSQELINSPKVREAVKYSGTYLFNLPLEERQKAWGFVNTLTSEEKEAGRYVLTQKARKKFEDKEERLLNFYEQKNYRLAPLVYKLLREVKPIDGRFRRDSMTPDASHELTGALSIMHFQQGGLLPEKVAYRMRGDKKFYYDAHKQSMENAHATHLGHDIIEDIPEVIKQVFIEYLNDNLSTVGNISGKAEALYRKSINFVAEGIQNMTFREKVLGPQGQLFNEEGKHFFKVHFNNNSGLYFLKLEEMWTTVIDKLIDKGFEGLNTRFPWHLLIEDTAISTVLKDKEYYEEIERPYAFSQTNERMHLKYPQLREAILVMNAIMDVALRQFKYMNHFHPKMMRDTKEAENAIIRIDNRLPLALLGLRHLPKDCQPLLRGQEGYAVEATRYSPLDYGFTQMRNQYRNEWNKMTKNTRKYFAQLNQGLNINLDL
jgi:hypothetical protein